LGWIYFGDLVKLNDQDIIAQRTFAVTKVRQDSFFSAFADNPHKLKYGVYNLSELDLRT
jgi:hypothetical protein